MGLESRTRYLVSVVLLGLFAIVYAISGTVLRRNSWKVIFPVMLVQMFFMGPGPASVSDTSRDGSR